MFADDTQLYVHCGRDNTALTIIIILEHRIMDINHWMSASRLKLNMDKTEMICTGTKYSSHCRKYKFPISLSLRLGTDAILRPSEHIRQLGVVISAELGIEKHVSKVNSSHLIFYFFANSCQTQLFTKFIH